MLEGVQHATAHLREEGFKRGVVGDRRTQRQGVNEVADERGELGLGSARGNGADQ